MLVSPSKLNSVVTIILRTSHFLRIVRILVRISLDLNDILATNIVEYA